MKTGNMSMKVGVVSDDDKTVSAHFGMARHYIIFDIQNGAVMKTEIRPKASHRHDEVMHLGVSDNPSSEANFHETVLSNVKDCEAIITRGMGYGMYSSMTQAGIKAFVTDIPLADDAVQEYIKGTLVNHLERLH
jgi:predicted Fe-Mo cluster-binding NifX family protein